MHGPMASRSTKGVVMAVTRVLFLARYRVPHACFALQFDHFLEGIDQTIIATPVAKEELWPVFEKYGIDTSTFRYVNDSVIYELYPQVNNWAFPGDYRGWWLRQQAIKLAYIDYLRQDVILMHDADTFMIKPYCCYTNGVLNLLSIMDTTQGSYNGVFESITGIAHPSSNCFVTELCAVRWCDFALLRQHLDSRFPGRCWLDAIIESVPGMPTVLPWGNGNIIKWFSEYELLGNWAVHCGNVKYQPQHRYEYNQLGNIAGFGSQHNSVCDAIPDLSQSLQMNWDTLTISGFAQHLSAVKEKI